MKLSAAFIKRKIRAAGNALLDVLAPGVPQDERKTDVWRTKELKKQLDAENARRKREENKP